MDEVNSSNFLILQVQSILYISCLKYMKSVIFI